MPSALPSTTRFRPKANVLVRELDGEAVLLDVATGRYFGLNATGVRIWVLLGEGEELGRIGERLQSEYAPAPESSATIATGATGSAIRSDLCELCAALEREGLVDRVG